MLSNSNPNSHRTSVLALLTSDGRSKTAILGTKTTGKQAKSASQPQAPIGGTVQFTYLPYYSIKISDLPCASCLSYFDPFPTPTPCPPSLESKKSFFSTPIANHFHNQLSPHQSTTTTAIIIPESFNIATLFPCCAILPSRPADPFMDDPMEEKTSDCYERQ